MSSRNGVVIAAVVAALGAIVAAAVTGMFGLLDDTPTAGTPTTDIPAPAATTEPRAGSEVPSQPVVIGSPSTTPALTTDAKSGRTAVGPGERLVPGEQFDSPQARPETPPPPVTNGATPGVPAPAAVAPTTRVALHPREQLTPGEQLHSPDGRFVLVMQLDGNLVQRAPGNQPVWSSNTFRPNSVALMQSDGNFVVIAPGNVPVWATDTSYSDSVLEVQNDGNVVVYSPGHFARWSSFDHGSKLVNP